MDLTPGGLAGVEAAAAAALRDPHLLAATEAGAIPSLVEAAERHGVAGLLLYRAARAGAELGAAWAPLRERTARQAAASDLRDRESRRILDRADRADIPLIVLKGLALAHNVYPEPWLRPRSDTDVLARPEDLPRVDALLRNAGYALLPHVRGELTLPQRHYVRDDERGFPHAWDVHWRLTASQALPDALPENDVWERSIAGPWRGSRALSTSDALVLACIHRLAHHFDDRRLIWLWDIRLLLEALEPPDLDRFASIAERSSPAAACGRSLAVAEQLAGASIPAALQPLIDRSRARDPAAFLWSGSRRRISYLLGELRAMPRSRRVPVLRERLLPSLVSMRERYPRVPLLVLPVMYPWRLVAAIPKWFSVR